MKKYFTLYLMLSRMLIIVFLLSGIFVQAQTVHYDYTDGKIYFKLKEDHAGALKARAQDGAVDINEAYLLQNIIKEYHITNLRNPFYNVESPILSNTYEMEFSDIEKVDSLINALQKTEAIEYAEKAPYHRLLFTPNDPAFASSQWYLKKINAEKAWDYGRGKKAISVAITDNAMYINHPDLKNSYWVNSGEIASNGKDDDGNGYIDDINGWDAGNNDNNTNPIKPSMSHGTYCSGIAGAVSNNNTGGASIGCGISIMAVKIWSDDESKVNAMDGIKYATASKARVISCSWGSGGSSQTEQNVINDSYSKGVIFVGAAGNENTTALFYPAAYKNVIAVAATDENDKKASFSNYGNYIDISAPGTNIHGPSTNNAYSTSSGTSAAAPIVAGLCGLMLSLNPALTPAQIENCLKSSATNINNLNPSYKGNLGAGRIDAAAAMKCVSLTTDIIPDKEISSYLRIFPNPSEGIFRFGFEAKETENFIIRITDMLGRLIYSENAFALHGYYSREIDLSNYGKGMYFLSLESNGNIIGVNKITIIN
jgi:serine protease